MRKRPVLALALACSMALALAAVAAEAPALDVEINLAPSADHEGAYQCRAVVRDARNGEVLSVPTVVFLRGQEARTTSEVTGGIVRLSVLVSDDGTEASYRAELLMDGTVVTSQSASIRL